MAKESTDVALVSPQAHPITEETTPMTNEKDHSAELAAAGNDTGSSTTETASDGAIVVVSQSIALRMLIDAWRDPDWWRDYGAVMDSRDCADKLERVLAATATTTEVSSSPAASPALKANSQTDSHEALLEAVDTWKRVAYGHGEDAHRLAAELVESESQRAALVEALQALVEATMRADNPVDMGLSGDDDVVTRARAALQKAGVNV